MLCLLVAELAVYANRTVFDSRAFADRATSTLDDEHVRAAISGRVVDQIIHVAPNLLAVRPILAATADGAAHSSAFQGLFRAGVLDAHRTLLGRDRDSVIVTAADVGVLVSSALEPLAPDIARHIPAGLDTKLLAISDGGAAGLGVDLGQAADANRHRAWIAGAGAVLFLGLALLFSASRRRTVWQAGIGMAVVGALVLVAWYAGRAIVVAHGADDSERHAVGAIWNAFLLDLRSWNVFLAGAGVVVAAAAHAVLRPVSLAPILRRAWEVVAATPARPLPRALRALGLIAGGAIAVMWPRAVADLVILVAGAGVLYAGVAELLRLTIPRDAARAPSRRPSRRLAPRMLGAGAVTAGVVAAGAVVTLAANRQVDPPFAISACNGRADLCDRTLDEVTFPSTHNSMSAATEPGWLFANQNDGIPAQLAAGVRGLLIDTHYGVRTRRGVYTVLQKGGKSRDKLQEPLGQDFVAAAERVRGDLGYRGGGAREVYLCHGFCELGATKAVTALAAIRDFVVAHPYEVLLISVEDDVSPEDTAAVFHKSGLVDYVYRGALRPMPTLRDLIADGRRVVVMGEDDVGDVPWFRQQFDFVQETPYTFADLVTLRASAACDPNRGAAANPLFLLNHWIETTPAPRVTLARRANARSVLLTRARACEKARGRTVNMVAVDLYREGDLFGVVDALNDG
ncbi:MAG: hypothetical protein QOG42_1179 [Solirubrobacteraceae bacterium]|nr:hypothetical protein [Solirubrobacteraceae bacterium]